MANDNNKGFYDEGSKERINKDECSFCALDSFPPQLVHRDFRFCQWSDSLFSQDGLYALLEEDAELYSPFSSEFQQYLDDSGCCGIVMGHGELVAVVLHNAEHFWKINAALGATCSIYDEEQNTVVLFYKVDDANLPTMTFIKRMSQRQEKNFKLLIAEKEQEALASPRMMPVFSLITEGRCMGLHSAAEHTNEPIKEISAARLLLVLMLYATPWPLAKAYYFEGQHSIEFEGVPLEVNEFITRHICLL